MNKQTHRTCVRMSAKEYSWLMERSKAAGLSANAWLMEQLAGNRPIISRNGVMSDFLCLLNQKGRESTPWLVPSTADMARQRGSSKHSTV